MADIKLTGPLYATMIMNGARNLGNSREVVNELNVFPVPDGDTGDNMFMTIFSGANASCVADNQNDELGSVAKIASNAMLQGARGNSGVILSQIYAGISKTLSAMKEADVQALAYAFHEGVKTSYHAVEKPVEGTILTVFRESVEFANKNVNDSSTMISYFNDLLEESKRSLEHTPELLPVLKEAGKVDSGGAGMVFIFEGMRDALLGKIIEPNDSVPAQTPVSKLNFDLFGPDSIITYGYCTEFFLRLQNSKVDTKTFDVGIIRDYLTSVGDSLVLVQNDTIVKVHVHTKNPGNILNEMQKYGEFLSIKIENMTLQHEETIKEEPEDRFSIAERKLHKKYTTVCVAAGEGTKNLFKQIGADQIVDGGQSMNPSSGDFLKAFEELDTDYIFVFPGNKNIMLAAKQAAGMYDKAKVIVTNAKTIGQSYAALSVFDPAIETAEELETYLNDSMHDVLTTYVAPATRDTSSNGVEIHVGDYLGYTDKEILVAAKTPNEAAFRLMEKVNAKRYDIALILKGKDMTEDEAKMLKQDMGKEYRTLETILTKAEQPIYNYVIILE